MAVFSPACAVIVTSPFATAVTTPFTTVATSSFELIHVTVLFVAFSGRTIAVNFFVSSTLSVASVSLNSIPVTATSSSFGSSTFSVSTVTLQVAVFSPAFAVIVASPFTTAVTTPFTTVATSSFELVHVTVLFVALLGNTVAVNFFVSPTVSVASVSLNVISVTATSSSFGSSTFSTVTLQVAVLFPAVAVIIASPSATAVTTPFATVATSSFELVHVTVLFVALLGNTVAVNFFVSPTVSVASVSLNSIPVTFTVKSPPFPKLSFGIQSVPAPLLEPWFVFSFPVLLFSVLSLSVFPVFASVTVLPALTVLSPSGVEIAMSLSVSFSTFT